MNRYVTEGIIRDLEDGKDVVLLGPHRGHAMSRYKEIVALPEPWGRVSKANGRESAQLGDGRLTVGWTGGPRFQDIPADVVVWTGTREDLFDVILDVRRISGDIQLDS